MSKFFQAFLTGVFFTFILDFFIFLGIKLHYVDFYKINVYYNILFADHQNIFIFALFSALIGFIVTYLDNNKINFIILGSLFFVVSLTLIAPIGNRVGEWILMDKDVTLYDNKHSYNGDSYYDGRKTVTFYDYELKKVIILDKQKLKGEN